MTYLQLLEQLRSRDDDFRRSRVDQAVLEAHRNIPIRQESTVPPYARKIIQDNIDNHSDKLNAWLDRYRANGNKKWGSPMPRMPDALDSDTLGERRENEIVLTDKPRLKSETSSKYGMSKEQLFAHELRHKALNDMGIKHVKDNHHPMIEAMEDPLTPSSTYLDWAVDPSATAESRKYWSNVYKESLQEHRARNRYLELLNKMGYEY